VQELSPEGLQHVVVLNRTWQIWPFSSVQGVHIADTGASLATSGSTASSAGPQPTSAETITTAKAIQVRFIMTPSRVEG
jgi:hypothetical protein